jgi:hypothetical protein
VCVPIQAGLMKREALPAWPPQCPPSGKTNTNT